MRIGVFITTVASLMLLFSVLNCFWIGRLLRVSLRPKFRIFYAVLTILGAAAYLGARMTGQFDTYTVFNIAFYFGPFWTILQLLLLLAWPVSSLTAWLLHRWNGMHAGVESESHVASALNPSLTRRALFSHAAMLPPLAMTGINTVGVLDAELRVVVRRIELAYFDLPPALDGLKIGHMTDVHVGPYVSARDVKKMATLLQGESPHLLAITGDFVDDVSLLRGAMDVMKPLLTSLPLGAWFCMGNHEHLRGAGPIRKILHESGVFILDNQQQRIPFGGGAFALAGVDYPMGASAATRPDAARRYIDIACGNRPLNDFTVLLAHHPDFLPVAFERNIHLTLSGHTHGGQVGWGQRSAFEFMYPYMRGVYGKEQSFGFVSSGAGHWMPFRLNCPPEVSVITLRRKA